MNYNHKNVFTRFCALLLAVITSLLLCVPAFAAYGSSPTYATGNYSYNSSTTSSTSTSSADWFTAVLAQLRTMYSYLYTKLATINTAVGLCESYLSETRDNTKKLIVMDVTLENIWKSLNSSIAPSVSSIKNDTSSLKALVGTSNTNTSSIYSQVLKLATEVTSAKILTAVQSISTDGLATEATLSDLNSKAATELTLSSINSKVATESTLSDFSKLFSRNQINFMLNTQTDSDGFQSYVLAQSPPQNMVLSLWNMHDVSNKMLLKLLNFVADPFDQALKDSTQLERQEATNTIGSANGINTENISGTYGLSASLQDGLSVGTDLNDAQTFVDGVLGGDTSSDYWSWFTQATADDLDQVSSGSSTRQAPRSPAQSTYWVIDPNATADDFINDWRNGNG